MLDNNKLASIKPLFSAVKEYARPEDYGAALDAAYKKETLDDDYIYALYDLTEPFADRYDISPMCDLGFYKGNEKAGRYDNDLRYGDDLAEFDKKDPYFFLDRKSGKLYSIPAGHLYEFVSNTEERLGSNTDEYKIISALEPEDYMSIRARRYGVSYTGGKIKTFDDLAELDDYIHTNPMLI